MTYFDNVLVDESAQPAPDSPLEIYLGALDESAHAIYFYRGKVFSFQIYKNFCSSANFTDEISCENAGEIWRENLVLNLVPAAKYSGCGENFALEYGFLNNLDNDGNFANDEFFANDGWGILAGSEEIVAPKCEEISPENPENPENSENSDNSNENDENFAENLENNSENSGAILPPNTGILKK